MDGDKQLNYYSELFSENVALVEDHMYRGYYCFPVFICFSFSFSLHHYDDNFPQLLLQEKELSVTEEYYGMINNFMHK